MGFCFGFRRLHKTSLLPNRKNCCTIKKRCSIAVAYGGQFTLCSSGGSFSSFGAPFLPFPFCKRKKVEINLEHCSAKDGKLSRNVRAYKAIITHPAEFCKSFCEFPPVSRLVLLNAKEQSTQKIGCNRSSAFIFLYHRTEEKATERG